MPRLPGGPAKNLPSCQREGHAERRVVKDGVYGQPPRQRFRCIGKVWNEKTGKWREFHRFAPVLPRLLAEAAVCDTCESEVHRHSGPVASRSYAFPVREVAAAFVAVGTGASYLQAADRARVAAGRERLPGERGGALVAEWLDLLAEVVIAPHTELQWPETLVLDSTNFLVTNPRTGTQTLAFHVLGAYGYPAQGRPRLWALHASHHGRQSEWEELLRSLNTDAPPRVVITDGAPGIGNAVRRVWPAQPSPSFPVPYVTRCEHHLRENAIQALRADLVDHWGSLRMDALNDALHTPADWAAFLRTITVKQPAARAWLAANAAAVTNQVAVRHLLPPHHSTAALDQRLGRVRDFLDSRSFVLRNKRRTNLLLGLVCNHLNGVDSERRYIAQLRKHLDEAALEPQRSCYDPGAGPRTPAAQRRRASLRT